MSAEATPLVQAAQLAGQHALPLFVGVLAGLLGLTGAAWWALRSHLVPRVRSALSPPLTMLVCMAIGFGAIVAGAWVFAELAEALQAQADLGRADQALADALNLSVPRSALQVFATLTVLANTATLTALCIVVTVGLVARGRRWLALGWVVAVAGNGLLNHTLKQVFERVRPVHDGGLVIADGFSFPSGHSSGSVVAYGMLAYIALRLLPPRWHLPVVLFAVAIAFTVGASRVFLRVHFASDVVAGFGSGSAWLAVCIASSELARWHRGRSRAG
jgi:undecaprenyl-diphosphatase